MLKIHRLFAAGLPAALLLGCRMASIPGKESLLDRESGLRRVTILAKGME
jgi:hypothetical protein